MKYVQNLHWKHFHPTMQFQINIKVVFLSFSWLKTYFQMSFFEMKIEWHFCGWESEIDLCLMLRTKSEYYFLPSNNFLCKLHLPFCSLSLFSAIEVKCLRDTSMRPSQKWRAKYTIRRDFEWSYECNAMIEMTFEVFLFHF